MSSRLPLVPLVAATIAAYAALVFGVGAPLMSAAEPLPLLDLRLTGYGLAEAEALLRRLGPEWRDWYAWVVVPVDMVFAALFGLTLAATARRLAPAAGRSTVLAAAIPALCDIGENLTIFALLRAGPDGISAGLVAIASTLTMLKFATLLPSLGLIGWLALRRRGRT